MVTTKWKASEVKAFLQYNNIQWKKLNAITKTVGDAVLSFQDDYWANEEKRPIYRWLDVPTQIHARVREAVNAKLREEGIPEVEEDVIYWRMVQLTRNALNKVKASHVGEDQDASAQNQRIGIS